MDFPLVSIFCVTYNHEAYIRECIEGFLMQKTTFPFEILIHDDASVDDTANIIREYEVKYSDLIKPIYQTENQWSKGITPGEFLFPMAKGKYMALCDGDDYWIDPDKLQKQVDFLEANEGYSMCFHNAIVHYENHNIKDHFMVQIKESREFSGIEIYEKWIVPTASVVIRKTVINSSIYQKASINKNFINGDIIIFLSAAECGRIWGMSFVMSVYRKHLGGLSYPSIKRQVIDINICAEDINDETIWCTFGKKYKLSSCKRITDRYNAHITFFFSKHKYWLCFKWTCKSFFKSPKMFVNRLITKIKIELLKFV